MQAFASQEIKHCQANEISAIYKYFRTRNKILKFFFLYFLQNFH